MLINCALSDYAAARAPPICFVFIYKNGKSHQRDRSALMFRVTRSGGIMCWLANRSRLSGKKAAFFIAPHAFLTISVS
jgi:hypothetical protein